MCGKCCGTLSGGIVRRIKADARRAELGEKGFSRHSFHVGTDHADSTVEVEKGSDTVYTTSHCTDSDIWGFRLSTSNTHLWTCRLLPNSNLGNATPRSGNPKMYYIMGAMLMQLLRVLVYFVLNSHFLSTNLSTVA